MQMISSRAVSFIDVQSLAPGLAREALFRDDTGTFFLYLCDGEPSSATEERVIPLHLREALLWLNESTQDQGSFWK
jgi:hypothetical protein